MGRVANMKLIILVCVIFAASLTDGREVGSLDRTFCCGSVQSRCAAACAGLDCGVQCQGNCGIFNTYCGLYTCGSLVNSCATTTTAATTTTNAVTTTTVAATTTTVAS